MVAFAPRAEPVGSEPETRIERWASLPGVEVWTFYNWMRPGSYCSPFVGVSAPVGPCVQSIEVRHRGRQQIGQRSGLVASCPGENVVVERIRGRQPASGEATLVGVGLPLHFFERPGDGPLPAGFIERSVHVASLSDALHALVASLRCEDTPPCRKEELLLSFAAYFSDAAPTVAPCAQAVTRSREYIHAHSTRSFSLTEMADAVGVSKWHLARSFREQMGVSPGQYARGLRVSHALALLRSGMSAAHTATRVGYCDQPHMTRELRAIWGITPARYSDPRELAQHASLR
jgi:AraC-like DNA-binding protein